MLVPAALSTVLYVAFKVSGRVLAPWLRDTLPNTKFRSAATVIGRNTLAVTFMVALFWACAVVAPAATSVRARTATFVAVCIWVLLLWRQSVVLRYRHTAQRQDTCPPHINWTTVNFPYTTTTPKGGQCRSGKSGRNDREP